MKGTCQKRLYKGSIQFQNAIEFNGQKNYISRAVYTNKI